MPAEAAVNAENEPQTNGLNAISVALDVAGFYRVGQDFGLPELVWWPASPEIYQPEPLVLQSQPNNLPVEQLPQPLASVQSVPQAAQAAYDNAVAIAEATYKQAVASAEAAHAATLTAATANHSRAVAAATLAKQAAINGYSPQDLSALEQAVQAAEQARHREVERVKQLASTQLSASQEAARSVRADRDQAAEKEFRSASDAARAASDNTRSAIEHRRMEAQDRLYNKQITQAQFDTISAALIAEHQAEERRLAVELSGYQQIYDNARIDHEAAESLENAAAQQVADVQIAEAGTAQQTTLAEAKRSLAVAQTANLYGQKRRTAAANDQYLRDVGVATEVYARAKADADALKAITIETAAATRDKAVAVASAMLSRAVAHNAASAIITTYSGDTSAAAAYRVAVARAERDQQVLQADALRDHQLATVDANLALEVALLLADADRTKQGVAAAHLRDQVLTDAAARFRASYLDLLQQQADEATSDRVESEQDQLAAQRDFEVQMAAVQQTRWTRGVNELKANRQAAALVQNKRNHELISKETYLSEIESLALEAKQLRLVIARETFGSPGASGSSAAGTESGTREAWLAAKNRAISELNQRQRARASDATRVNAELSATHEEAAAEAERSYEAAMVDASLAANSAAQSAIENWVRLTSQNHAAYQASLASAAAANAIASGRATVGFYTATSRNRAEALESFASAGDNPWASREAAVAEADAARVSSIATAYLSYLDTTVTAAATAVSEAVAAQATLTAEVTTAQIAASASIQAAIATYATTMAGAEQVRDTNLSAAVSDFDTTVATAHGTWQNTEEAAKNDRSIGYFVAMLQSLLEAMAIIPQAPNLNVARRAREVGVGTSYAATVIGAQQYYLTILARENKDLHDAIAALRADYETTSADALEDLQQSQANSNLTASTRIAAAQSVFATSLATLEAVHDTDVLDADYSFAVAVADANRTYAKQQTTADIDLSIAVAQRESDAVDAWAANQLDVNGRVLPTAQYSVAVYQAALKWQREATPYIQSYYDAIADEYYDLAVGTASAIQRAGRGRVSAAESFTIAVADAEKAFNTDLGTAHQQWALASASINAAMSRASTDLAKTFADAFAAGRSESQVKYATRSASSETSLVDYRSQLHTQQISSQDYQDRREQTHSSLMLSLAAVDRDFAVKRANAAEQWGHELADEHHDKLSRSLDAAADLRHSVVDAYKDAGYASAAAVEEYTTEIAQLDAAGTIAIVKAEAAFDHSAALHWATLVENMGRLDVDYAAAVATAEVAHHIAVAEEAVQKLIGQFGSRPNQSQQFAIRVAEARVEFFRDVTEDYIGMVTSTARQSAKVDSLTAKADAKRQEARGAAVVSYVTTTQNALADGISQVARASRTFARARLDDFIALVRASVAADKDRQTTMAEAFRTAGREYATAEATAYRSAAEETYESVRMFSGSGPAAIGLAGGTSSGRYLGPYNRAHATLHFKVDAALATSGGVYEGKIATALTEQVSRLATAADVAVRAGSAAQHRLDVKTNDALRDFRNAYDDADKNYERSIAKITYDSVVARAQNVHDAMLVQYRSARDLYASFDGLPDLNVRYAIAQVRGAYAYAKALLPNYLVTQTTIADANLNYANTVIDAQREHQQRLTNAAHSYGRGIADAQQTHANTRSASWVTAVNAYATSVGTARATIAAAMAVRGNTAAALKRDAAIAAGWGKLPRIDADAEASATQKYEDVLAKADSAQKNAEGSARDRYFRELAIASRTAETAAADRDHTFSLAAINSLAELRTADINAESAAAQIEVNARHGYRIADIDAVIVGLTAVRNDFNTTATEQARFLAVTSRDQRVSVVEGERTTALQRIVNAQGAQLAVAASEKSGAIRDVNAVRDQQRKSAQSRFDQAVLPNTLANQKLPHIVNSQQVSLGLKASQVPFMDEDPLALVDNLTTRFTFGSSGRSLGEVGGGQLIAGIADELYVYTGVASAVDMGIFVIKEGVGVTPAPLRHLPHGDEAIPSLWATFRQQAAQNAQGVIQWGQSVSAGIAAWGAGGGSRQYGLGVLGSSLTEGTTNLFAGLAFDPVSTAENLVGVADAYYRAGGTVAVVGAFTGGLSVYESLTGSDFLTGRDLTGADRFDRAMLGTSAILTGLGTSGLLRNIATRGGGWAFPQKIDNYIVKRELLALLEAKVEDRTATRQDWKLYSQLLRVNGRAVPTGAVSSNFEVHLARIAQTGSPYGGVDNWALTTLQAGTIVYGGFPGQSAFYTDFTAVFASRLHSPTLFKALQVSPHPTYGYRPSVQAYRLTKAINIPASMVAENPHLGPGGALQFFMREFQKYLTPVRVINLSQ